MLWFNFFILFLSLGTFALKARAENDVKANISMTVPSLDRAWENRENKEEGKSILKFLENIHAIPENFDLDWRISRLVYFIGNFSSEEDLNGDERTKIFELGYKAGEKAKNEQPDRVEGYYWYAINLGTYSLSVGLFKALNTASDARDALVEASQKDPNYHWGGAYRILGRYYQDLPSGISFGDKKKAAQYFKKAIEISPNFRLNTVYLAELESDKDLKLKLLEEAKKKPNMDGAVEEERYQKKIELDLEKLKN